MEAAQRHLLLLCAVMAIVSSAQTFTSFAQRSTVANKVALARILADVGSELCFGCQLRFWRF